MEPSPTWETNSHSASQISPPFMEPKVSLSCSQEPAIGPYPESDVPSPHLPTLFTQDPF